MATTVITVAGYDPGYLEIFESLVRDELDAGNRPVVFDITGLTATPIDSFHRGVLRRFGLEYPGHDIRSRMSALGARYVWAADLAGHDDRSPLSPALEEKLEIAVQSALITYFRTDRPDRRKRLVSRTADGLVAEGRAVYRTTLSVVAEFGPVAYAYVPNGRFPHQKLATLAFADALVPTKHIEKGEGVSRAYVQDYAPQDRLRSQAAVDEVLSGLTEEQIDAIADAWLARRAPAADSRNEFSTLWDDTLPETIVEAKKSGRRIAAFFTSSQDEFQFLGPEWQLHDWQDQFQAFDLILNRLEARGYVAYLRVHPNLATKAHECFVRERAGIRELAARHPGLIVIWHDDQANSYSLLEASDVVFVWDSTIGLEASARGLPVWTTATSRYGLVADIRELLAEGDLESVGLEEWVVDPHRAKRFIAYLVLRDRDVRPGESWTPWDAGAPPLGARLAAVAVAGGAPTAGAAVGSLVDVYRHRSLSANRRARAR